jgi:hypothetical protein
MKKYIVVDIGCLECGVSSGLVGIFTDKIKAESIAHRLDSSNACWIDGGQHSFQMFETLEDNVISDSYSEYLNG